MHIGIITYQVPHRKTFDVVSKLVTQAGYRITLYAFPFKHRPPPPQDLRYADRPDQLIQYDVQQFCEHFNVRYVPMPGWSDSAVCLWGEPGSIEAPNVFLHCTAKIIPANFLHGRYILNCHPGLLPYNRGVDAFKWCIVNEWPIGITLHQIDEAIDRGTILYRLRIPVFKTDSLKAVCQRAYAYEIDLLANFSCHMNNKQYGWGVSDAFPVSHQLILKSLDQDLERLFLTKRNVLSRLSGDYSVHFHEADNLLGRHFFGV